MKKLGDVCEIKTGKKDTKNKEDDGEYPFFVRSNTVERINSYSYDGEAILTSGDGVGVGKNFHYINGKFDFHQRVYSLRKFKNGYIGKYIYYLFSDRFYDRVTRLSAKNSVDSVRMDMISGMQVYFPLSTEQTKISSFLSLIDERIQTQIKIIEELKLLKNTLGKKIFSRQLRFKDDNGNDFPEWQHKKLGELATITTGSSNREDSILDGEYTFFDRSQDVRTSKRYLFNKEAVIVPGEGQKFTPKYFMGKFDLHQRTYAIFDFIELSGKYLYYHIDIDEKYLQSQAVGSTVKSLRLPMFQSMPIKFPPLEEQMKIANFLSSIDTKIDVETELLEKLEEQKKYLLQNLFI
ncbi:restriction endonuclease subunit S [Empedobacter falsenii]